MTDRGGPPGEAVVASLRMAGLLELDEQPELAVLDGGVSNQVLAVRGRRLDAVVKLPLARLRVAEEWTASLHRTATEAAALRLAGRLQPSAVPPVLHFSPSEHLLALGRAPAQCRDWRALLLAGHVDPAIGARLGEILARWHLATTPTAELRAAFGDREVFGQLRVDPFYHWTARRRPEMRPLLEETAARMAATVTCLVHGDFSPKNVLVGPDLLWVIDWEVAHLGDPVFDLAFLLSHLVCKALHRPSDAAVLHRTGQDFLSAYRRSGGPDPEAGYLVEQLACLVLARMDGKSPVPYLDEAARERGRVLARSLADPGGRPGSWSEMGGML